MGVTSWMLEERHVGGQLWNRCTTPLRLNESGGLLANTKSVGLAVGAMIDWG